MTSDSSPETVLTPEILVPRLGDYLLEKGLISREDLRSALDRQQEIRGESGKQILLGQILVEMGVIDKAGLDQAITEQIIQLRAALQETNAQLEQRVQERTAELQSALLKLSELSQLKSNIVSNISHELRTPLTHIKGYVELLVSEAMGSLTEQQVSALQVVQRSSERLEQQVEDLIRFSTSEKGEFTLRISAVDVRRLFETVVSRASARIRQAKHEIHILCPPDLPRVRADEEKISWAVLALVDNAIKFTPPCGKITLRAENTDGLITIAVEDTGIGIPADRIGEIFEPFHQLDGSATRRYGGTGLGLALVRQIIEAHGSIIHVNSVIDQGTRFEFVLPPTEIRS
ncbi:MAG TPA: ATP-binding protein [Anaerolineaceae bacterium]|nr:ATP-binding protein [Anaerolineaceae bacterium]